MRGVIVRLWRLYNTPHGKKMFRYTMVSVVSTAVSTVVLLLVYGVFRLWTEVPSTLFANLVATVPSYYLNRTWAWGKTGRSHIRREIVPFWTLSIAGMLLSIGTESEARHIGLAHFQSHHLARTVLVLAANFLAFGLLWVIKFLAFNRLFKVALVDDPDENSDNDGGSELVEAGPRP
jgi:putative flippase GtrA